MRIRFKLKKGCFQPKSSFGWDRSSLSFLVLFFLFCLYAVLSYFGRLNPNIVGLKSSIGVVAIGFSIGAMFASISKKYLIIYLSLVWLIFNILIITNWWHFQYFRAYYNFQAISFTADSIDGFKSFEALKYKKEAVTLLTITGLMSFLTVFLYNFRSFRTIRSFAAIGVCFFGSIMAISSVEAVSSNLRSKNSFILSPEYLHPVHAFFSPVEKEAVKEVMLKDWLYFKGNNKAVSGPDNYSQTEGNRLTSSSKRYNVITIVIESFKASFVGHYGSSDGLTKNFDKFASENISAQRFYANTNYTVKAESAIFCGIFDHNIRVSIAEHSGSKNLNCIPAHLKKFGYTSWYFHGNRSGFYNRQAYMKEMGFENLYFHADNSDYKEDGREYLGWGISDEDMFEIMLEKLQDTQQPFFANLMTLTNHYPFNSELPIETPFKNTVGGGSLSDHELYQNYKNTIFYSDYAFGQFWKQFKKSSLYSNTIVIVTADHGIWSFPEADKNLPHALLNERFFRMPLAIYHPEIKSPIKISEVSSQVDILPTLMGLLDVEYESEHYIGKDMFKATTRPWAVMMKSGEVFVRQKNQVCYKESTSCGGPHQVCFSSQDPESIAGLEKCDLFSDDPLSATSLAGTLNSRDKIVDRGFSMIGYENGRVFEDKSLLATHKPVHLSRNELERKLIKP